METFDDPEAEMDKFLDKEMEEGPEQTPIRDPNPIIDAFTRIAVGTVRDSVGGELLGGLLHKPIFISDLLSGLEGKTVRITIEVTEI